MTPISGASTNMESPETSAFFFLNDETLALGVCFTGTFLQNQLSFTEMYIVVQETPILLHIRVNDHWLKDTPRDLKQILRCQIGADICTNIKSTKLKSFCDAAVSYERQYNQFFIFKSVWIRAAICETNKQQQKRETVAYGQTWEHTSCAVCPEHVTFWFRLHRSE